MKDLLDQFHRIRSLAKTILSKQRLLRSTILRFKGLSLLDSFPPENPNPLHGIEVTPEYEAINNEVDCINRIHLCKVACCRLHFVTLTAKEARSNLFEIDKDHPYQLQRDDNGVCKTLDCKTLGCSKYENRPNVCKTYSCENDARIWEDFKSYKINPALEEEFNETKELLANARNSLL